MSGTSVRSVQRKEGYQPPEGAEEIATAIRLAQLDKRLRDKVSGWNSTGILTAIRKGKPGFGHRVLYVTFSRSDAGPPNYYAFVDLTEGRVLVADSTK